MEIVPIRTNLFAGEFSPSGVESARCFRRFYYQKMLGLQPKVTPVAMVFGICIHGAVELFYQLRSKIGGQPTQEQLVEIKIAVVQEFMRIWVEKDTAGDIKRNLETGVMIMSNYCNRYAHDSSSFDLADIESAQWVAMPNGTMMLVKMDRVLNQGNLIILVDTKTTSSGITPYYFRDFENHLPTSLYAYTVQQLLGQCDMVMIDAIKVPPPSSKSTSEPFGRANFLRTPLQIEDAITTYCNTTDYIMSVLKKPKEEWAQRMYCNQGECSKYSGCSFLPICKYGLDHPSVKVDFDIKPPKNNTQLGVAK